jgi:hypothetical protein
MNSFYDELIDSIMATGISEEEARNAARRCAMAMGRHAAVGYAGGGALGFFLQMNPATALPYLVGGLALGAGHGLAKAPQCAEVRQAIGFWNTARI